MNMTSVIIEGEGTALVADNIITDFTAFLDPAKKFILRKRRVGNIVELTFYKKAGDVYKITSCNKIE